MDGWMDEAMDQTVNGAMEDDDDICGSTRATPLIREC